MKTNMIKSGNLGKIISLGTLAVILAGCGTTKEKPVQSRGWVGGEFRVVRQFPKLLASKPASGILLTALGTNTPARAAGLREGDLILSLDHKPVMGLKDFRRKIDASEPGTLLPVTAYRDGQTLDYNVPVGREMYRSAGSFGIYLGLYSKELRLVPSADEPGISLFVLGYHLNPGHRAELGSVEKEYFHKCNPNEQTYDEDYNIWLVLMELSRGKNIVDQQMVAAW
jgi:hypothetical protein